MRFCKISLLVLIFVTIYSQNLAQNNSLLDTENLKEQIDSLIKKFRTTGYQNINEGIESLEKALEINQQINNDTIKACCYYGLGWSYRILGNFKLAMQFQHKAEHIYNILEIDAGLVSTSNELALNHKKKGDYNSAVYYYLKAIDIAEKTGNQHIGELYHNLALIYGKMGKQDQSLNYLQLSLEMKTDSALHFTNYINIGNVYSKQGDDSLALIYYDKALDNAMKYNRSQDDVNDVIINKSDILAKQGEKNAALLNLFTIQKFQKQNGREGDLAETYQRIAKLYLELSDLINARHFANKWIEKSKKCRLHHELMNAYLFLSELYKFEDNYESMVDVLFEYIALKDSLFSVEKSNHADMLLAKFDAERKENEILLLKNKQDLQQKQLQLNNEELKNRTLVRNIAVLSALVILFIAVVIVWLFQQRVRNSQLLALEAEKNNKREIHNLIKDHEIKTINARLEGKEKERNRIASDLHDGIGGNLASIKLQLSKCISQNDSKELLSTILNNVDETYQEVRAISHNLSPLKIVNGSYSELIANDLNNIKVANNLDLSLAIFPERILDDLSDNLKIETYRITQELVSNILKHAKAKSVDIQFTLHDKSLNIMVEDDGVGFSKRKIISPGIGLETIKSRVKALSGTINIDTAEGRGTIIDIDLPV